ncbi:MAG: DUF4388 domain-containing protein [Planctomycetota bacterium]|nr:MAG: DUF4388 domain-containing protein [Planctomycetota bacterium]
MEGSEQFGSPDYEIMGVIGKGAMGVVLKARYIPLDKLVAIKLIQQDKASNPEFIQRFLREMSAVINLDHPHIVKAYDYGIDVEKDRLFVSLEFVDGGSLRNLLKLQGALPLPKALSYAKQIAKGLDYAHKNGIFHRDIKPDNILITQDGVAKIADFGLAKSQESGALTSAGTILGTPYYVAPEIVMELGEVNHRVDIYSLGITLFHLIAGRPPFWEGSVMRIISAHCTQPLPSLSSLVPEIPSEIDELIQQMGAKNPDERIQSAGEVAARIEEIEKKLFSSQHSYSSFGQQEEKLVLSGDISDHYTGLRGKLKTISFPELVQVIILSGKSGVLTITRYSRKDKITYHGEVTFKKGEAIHCWCNDLQGEEAFQEILSWHGGRFIFQEDDEVDNAPNLPPNTLSLLADSLRKMDEAKANLSQASELLSLASSKTGLKGSLDSLSLLEVIQSISLMRKTGILYIEKNNQELGKLYFQNGNLIHGQAGELEGEDSFYLLVQSGKGFFRFQESSLENVQTTITTNTGILLMNGCRLLEEQDA